MNDRAVTQFCYDRIRDRFAKESGLRDSVSAIGAGAVSRVNESLRDREFIKKLLRASLLGVGGAAVGGLGGSLIPAKGIDPSGRPKRKSRAGLGALVGGATGAAVGLLAKSKFPGIDKVNG